MPQRPILSIDMYQPQFFTNAVQQELRDYQVSSVIEVSNIVEFLTNRAVGLISELGSLPSMYGLSGANLLMTLIRELDMILGDLLTQNDVDIHFFIKLLKQNAVYPARTILDNRTDLNVESALSKLAVEALDADQAQKYALDGTANDDVSMVLRSVFAKASRKEELVPDTKPHVVSNADVDMGTWLAMLAITYLITLDLVMDGGNYVTN